ncbi:General stress protein 16O [Pseudobythopirellula maris]|uniref:General stress protein 16O n=1 Tax=Pseudobythopirellula maris TaxID=2527991 RepID=A0A5C5ZGY9_9BACT|nr:TraR/DksA C4-type zinc finger protein [Pseudobythopirellula maris]TWT86584.1 General stress protein 16O [Pseudobythopirellula maris]
MTTTQIEDQRTHLERDLLRLNRELTRLREESAQCVNTPGDRVSAPSHPGDHDSEGAAMRLQEVASHRLILQQTEEALARIEAGEYGRCTRCGEEISAERLDAVPYAAHCIACEQEATG